jgi:hypothetical protein
MNLLQRINMALSNDPYWVGPEAHITHFLWHRTFVATTAAAFKAKYKISCFVQKINVEEFRAARMLDENNQEALIDAWHKDVFLPLFQELRCSFHFFGKWANPNSENPCLCRIEREGDREFLFWDLHCVDLEQRLKKLPPFEKNGCSLTLSCMNTESYESLIKENYDMIKMRAVDIPDEASPIRILEEFVVIKMLHQQFELEQQFQHIQTNQKHKGHYIRVETQLVASTIKLTWDCNHKDNVGYRLRGYRNDTGFADNRDDLSRQGTCVVDTQSRGESVQRLLEGREYFYTFLLTNEEPVNAEETFMQNVRVIFGSPIVKGMRTIIVDSVRFAIRVPTPAELARVEQSLEKIKQPSVDPKREKINLALEELSSFVEFEENISELVMELVKRIERKGYPPKEKAQKIARLKALASQLCMA